MKSLLQQLKRRRLAMGLKQNDMMLRVGVSRQQYQRLESKGNPRLDTLELIAKGLNSEIVLVPKEVLVEVNALLEGKRSSDAVTTSSKPKNKTQPKQSDDPWQDLLGED